MRQNKKLMAGLAAVMAVATLAGTSAFADSRPQRGTRSSGGAIHRGNGATRGETRRGNDSVTRGETRRGNDSVAREPRRGNDSVSREPRRGNDSVSRGDTQQRGNDARRGNGRTYENDRDRSTAQRYGREETLRRNGNDRNRSGANNSRNRSGDNSRNRSYGNDSRYRNAQPYHTRGRISRMHRYNGGYRVWVVGAPYPFFIPDRYYRRDRFNVGLWINLGGYYNPLGYYDYYDGYSYDGYSDRRSYSRGELRGVVESVDSRRTSFVLRNEDTGSYVTVLPRARRVYVRPGDYVEVDGTWTRSGYFTAYDIDWPDRDRSDDDRYDDERYDR